MNKRSTIDSIFKNQLQQIEQGGAEENWQRLEKDLLQLNKKKQRKRAAGWLGLLLLLSGGAALVWGLQSTGTKGEAADQLVSSANDKADIQPASKAATMSPSGIDMASNSGNDATDANDNDNTNNFNKQGRQKMTISGGDIATTADDKKQAIVFNKKGAQKININPAAATEEDNEEEETAAVLVIPVTTLEQAGKATANTNHLITNEPTAKQDPTAKEVVTDKTEDKEPPVATAAKKEQKKGKGKLQLELAAGIDISNDLGKYGMAMLRIPLNKKANLIVGGGYADNKMVEGYKVANKPNVLNREIDAKLSGLTMLQFPILYEQAIKDNKLFFRAGATPVYVLDATIVNMPNSSGANPANYRTFTMSDINKLNVLFTAGFQYRLTPRLGIELKGNYGLTELVKNSYINQSGENNNFKSAQLGVLLMLGKKR